MTEPAVPPDTSSFEALSKAVAQLRSERDGLRQAMRNRAVIEQAKGMLVERLGVTPDQAFSNLVELSTHNNVKVAELAAAMVAGQAPAPPPAPKYLQPSDGKSDKTPVPAPPPTNPTADVGTLAADAQLLHTRIRSAQSFDEVAAALAVPTSGWPAPVNVILLLLEADGALRLVGSAGLSPTARSQWDRVPPIEQIPLVAAVTKRAPVLLSDAAAFSANFPVVADHPHEALIAMPLILGDNVLGVVELTWEKPLAINDLILSHLHALAEPCAHVCEDLAGRADPIELSADDGSVDPGLLPLFLEAVNEPAALLSPVYADNGQIIDFTIDSSSPAARRMAKKEQLNLVSGSLLVTLPEVGSQVLLPALAQVAQTGEPFRIPDLYIDAAREGTRQNYVVNLQAVRLWDRVLVTWRAVSIAERLWDQSRFTEKVFKTGSLWWDLQTGETRWSPGLYRLLGRSPDSAPARLDQLSGLIEPEDVAVLTELIGTRLRQDNTLQAEVRGAGQLAGRRFQITATAKADADQHWRWITCACRELTDSPAVGRSNPGQIAAAAGRAHAAELAATVEELTGPATPPAIPGLRCLGALHGPREPVLGCWYDAIAVSPRTMVVILGEVSGERPAGTVQRLRHAATGYVLAGMTPAQVLAALNSLCRVLEPGRTATVSVTRVDVEQSTLDWAAAGRNAPVLLDQDGSSSLRSGALGMAIGAIDGLEYQSNPLDLLPGQQLLLYNEELLASHDSALPDTLAALLAAATRRDIAEVIEELHARVPHSRSSDLCVVTIGLDTPTGLSGLLRG